MSALWVPDHVARTPKPRREHVETTREWEQMVLSQMHATGGVLDHWNAELKQIDRNLRLMQATDRAHAPGVKPGYYHLVRLRDSVEGTFMWVNPIAGPNGEFIEPTQAMLEGLRMSDLQNASAVYARRRADEQAAASAANDERREDADRLQEGIERLKAATRTQILTSRDVAYSQNNSPAARRARAEARKSKP